MSVDDGLPDYRMTVFEARLPASHLMLVADQVERADTRRRPRRRSPATAIRATRPIGVESTVGVLIVCRSATPRSRCSFCGSFEKG
jgi:hypothetical protein